MKRKKKGEPTVPTRQVLVCDARADVEHHDGALGIGIKAIVKATHPLTLADSIPHVKVDLAIVLKCGQGQFVRTLDSRGTAYRGEDKRIDFGANSGYVLLFEISCRVTHEKSALGARSSG